MILDKNAFVLAVKYVDLMALVGRGGLHPSGVRFVDHRVSGLFDLFKGERFETAVEIGVLEGWFSSFILGNLDCGTLHLVDPWETQPGDVYRDPANVDQKTMDRRFQLVMDKFLPWVSSGKVRVDRRYSKDAIPSMGPIDWAYVDGNHSYEGCLSDLRLLNGAMASNGAICGHDFGNKRGFRVADAVRDFCAETDWRLWAIVRYDPCVSYVLRRMSS